VKRVNLLAAAAATLAAAFTATSASATTTHAATATVATTARPTATASSGVGVLGPGHFIKRGQYVVSANKAYALLLQDDGNLVLYKVHNGKAGAALWATNTRGGAVAGMQYDGNFVVYNAKRKALWASNTSAHSGAVLVVQNDGNLVVYGQHKVPLWWRTITIGALLPGEGLGVNEALVAYNHDYFTVMQADGNLVEYRGSLLPHMPRPVPVWSSHTNQAGSFAVMQTDGNFVIYNRYKRPIWSTGTRSPGAYLDLQNDSNLVLYSSHENPIWWRTPGN
jgi:hypothetical protein